MNYIAPVEQYRGRRIVHPSHRQTHVTPITAPLYVVTVIFNPNRYKSRYALYPGFEKHCEDAGAILYTVEIALRDRHHEVTHHGNSRHIQLRVESELWYKENGGNIGLRFLPPDWEYCAFVDADFLFTRADWATETLQMLQHHDAVQMFHSLTYLNNEHRVHNQLDGFVYTHLHQGRIPKKYGHKGAVGGAWAFRRSALEKLGGLLETCILGSGDWHMAFALAMRDDIHPEMKFHAIPQYVKSIRDWAESAKALHGNIGYVDTNAIHHWHGALKSRGYETRWKILVDNKYDPYIDVRRDWQGLLYLSPGKPQFRDDIRAYFRSRSEDELSPLGA